MSALNYDFDSLEWVVSMSEGQPRGYPMRKTTSYSPAEIAADFRSTMAAIWQKKWLVFRLSVPQEGVTRMNYTVELSPWNPFACQGGFGYLPYKLECYPRFEDIIWTRDSQVWGEQLAEMAFGTLLQIVLSAMNDNNGTGGSPLNITGAIMDTGANMSAAARFLVKHLPTAHCIRSLEFTIDFDDSDSKKAKTVKMICELFRRASILQQQGSSSWLLESVAVIGLSNLQSCEDVDGVLQALCSAPKALRNIHLARSRYAHSWYRDSRGWENDANLQSISLLPLAKLLSTPGCDIRLLDLSCNPLNHVSEFFQDYDFSRFVSLQTLLLRGTGMNEKKLLDIFHQLGGGNNPDEKPRSLIRKLDVSHNPFTSTVMQKLVWALCKNTKMLECIIAEHCEINIEQVLYLADHIDGCSGLRHLFLDGNVFNYTPLRDECVSVGATIMAEAVVQKSKSLLTLRMGDEGHVLPFGRACCTGPGYTPLFDTAQLNACLDRNLRVYHEYQELCLRGGIVRLAALFLNKLQSEQKKERMVQL